jgi:hypothetical protein
MTKVVVGFLCEGVGVDGGKAPPKLMRYLPRGLFSLSLCQGCKSCGTNGRAKYAYKHSWKSKVLEKIFGT